MFKKNKFGLLVLIISITVFLSGCSQDAYSGFFNFMGGNVYSDDFDLELPGESGAGAEVASEQATETDAEDLAVTDEEDTDAIEDLNSDDTNINGDGLAADGTSPGSQPSNGDGTAGSGGTKVVIEKVTKVTVPEQIKGVEDDAEIKVVAISSKITDGADAKENVKLLVKANSGEKKKVIGIATVDANNNPIVSIPMFKPLSEEDQELLAAEYSTKNPAAKEKIKQSMKLPEEDPIKLISAHNAMVEIGTKNKTLADKFAGLDIADEPLIGGIPLSQKIVELTEDLTPPELSDNPTKEEILNVQLSREISSALTNAVKLILEDGEVDVDLGSALNKPAVRTSLLNVVKNAEAAMAIARVNSDNTDVIDGLDFGSLLDAINDANKSSKSGSKEELDESVDIINEIANNNKSMVKMLLRSYIGIKQVKVEGVNTYVYDETLNDANALANVKINDLFKQYFSGSYLAGEDADAKIREVFESDFFTGLDGVLDYTLSFVLNNIDNALEGVAEAYNEKANDGNNYTVKQLVDGYLENDTILEVLNQIYGTGTVDVAPLYEEENFEDDPFTILFEDGNGEFDPLPNIFTKDTVGYEELNQFIDNCKQIELNTDGGLGVLSELLDDLNTELEALE